MTETANDLQEINYGDGCIACAAVYCTGERPIVFPETLSLSLQIGFTIRLHGVGVLGYASREINKEEGFCVQLPWSFVCGRVTFPRVLYTGNILYSGIRYSSSMTNDPTRYPPRAF